MRARTALPALLLTLGLAATGCATQPEEANDNGPQLDATQPPDVVRTPEPVESAPLTVPLPGPTNSPNLPGETPSS